MAVTAVVSLGLPAAWMTTNGLGSSAGPSSFRSERSDVLFFGHQETLTADFERLEVLGVRSSVCLPTDDVAAHRAQPGDRTELSEAAQQHLRQWYSRDYDFLDLLANMQFG